MEGLEFLFGLVYVSRCQKYSLQIKIPLFFPILLVSFFLSSDSVEKSLFGFTAVLISFASIVEVVRLLDIQSKSSLFPPPEWADGSEVKFILGLRNGVGGTEPATLSFSAFKASRHKTNW